MPPRAQVTSVEVLEEFRASLIIYVSKARPVLDEVSADVVRMRMWLQDEQRTHWENELRRCTRVLQEAQQALFSARLSSFREETSAELMAVHRARRAADAAEDKLRVLKKWNRDFDNHVEPLVKQMEKLQTVLAHDMVQAIAYLTQAISTLHAYAQIAPGPATPPGSRAPGESGASGKSADEPGAPPAGHE